MNIEIERPKPEPKGLSKKTLDTLSLHAKRMHWFSLEDKALREVFKSSAEMLPGFDRESWSNVRRIILLLEENEKIKKRDIPQQELSIDPFTKKVRLGNQYKPSVPIKYAPIFNPFAQRMIMLMVGNRFSEIPKMSSKQRGIVQDNIDILKSLYGWESTSPW